MAAKGYVFGLLGGLPPDLKRVLHPVFEYVMDNWRLGDGARAENAQWYGFDATTAAVPGAEFSIVHGQGVVPRWLIPVVDLNTVGSQLVPLTVTRVPDAARVYLSSPTASASFRLYLEF